MEETVPGGPEPDGSDAAPRCVCKADHGKGAGNPAIPPPCGTRGQGDLEMAATILTSNVPGPFGAGARDNTPGAAWDAAGGSFDGDLGSPHLGGRFLHRPPGHDPGVRDRRTRHSWPFPL